MNDHFIRMEYPNMFKYKVPVFKPLAKSAAIIIAGDARFTILTPYLIRMEYDPAKTFEDRPSQVFWYREQPAPNFSYILNESTIQMETDALKLSYQVGKPFDTYTLSIFLKDNQVMWNYGDDNKLNLKGTYRTLDSTNGPVNLEPGLNSLSGWSLVNDSDSLVFTPEGWLTPRNKPMVYQDLYFFGYGSNYLACIKDYQKITGNVPLLPRWALGNWWSRYWPYHQNELLDLMDDFSRHEIPLSVCIIDMDWHITKTGNKSSGWTGYTWNPDLFPNPPSFLNQLHARGLHTALNLHPAEGIHPHEAAYPEFAERMGINPDSKEPIRFDIADPKFTSAYFELLHRPLEQMGVDFWWLDWQQGEKTSIDHLDPLFWLNHLHACEQQRDGSKRPFIFSRWPGLGGHRYPIGFSGDTHVSWQALNFQPYFTSTAANVAFGWWSHDIGGHMNGVEDAELYLRWLQFGLFSPILRLHSTNNPYHERRPWGYDADTEKHARAAMQLRHRLVPYIYSASYKNETSGVPLILPMYFCHPHNPAAYQSAKQYYFGSELIAAPFTQPADPDTAFTRQVVWLPKGNWFNFFTGEYFKGDGWYAVYGRAEDIPVFARAGAIIPLSNDPSSNLLENPQNLALNFFTGDNNSYSLFEDDGHSMDYQDGHYSISKFEQQVEDGKLRIIIHPVEGVLNHLPDQRKYHLTIFGISDPEEVMLSVSDEDRPVEFIYDQRRSSLEISPFECAYDAKASVAVKTFDNLLSCTDRRLDHIARFINYTKLNTNVKAAFMQKLQVFIKNPGAFTEVMHNFNPGQILAIAEMVFGRQIERISYGRDEEIQKLYGRFLNG
jgi:alpha-glucosidase (family GH31 glycosyl hydrolase)